MEDTNYHREQSAVYRTCVLDVVNMLATIAGEQVPRPVKRRKLMSLLCKRVQADSYLLVNVSSEKRSGGLKKVKYDFVEWDGFTEKLIADFSKSGGGIMRLLKSARQEAKLAGQRVTQLASEMTGEIVSEVRSDLGGSPELVVVSMGRTAEEEGEWAGGVVIRSSGKSPFVHRDKLLIHLLLSNVEWLCDSRDEKPPGEVGNEADANTLDLAPRVKEVLRLLLRGESRKSIAGELDITVNTVSSYVKEIYQHYGVHSQSQLICLFLSEEKNG